MDDYLEGYALEGGLGTYMMQKFLGEGSFGEVFLCKSLSTQEMVAVKIIEKRCQKYAEMELNSLEYLKMIDVNKNNLVRLIEQFISPGIICLVFEILDINLHELMRSRSMPLSFSEIRVITQQMLVALNALKGIGLVHTDIKPDNIMLVNHELQPFKIKLIDFGLACQTSKLIQGSSLQALSYRAPEVMLGLPLNEAIDMWSLACVVLFLSMNIGLPRTNCVYDRMKFMTHMMGQPDDRLLDAGFYTDFFFKQDQDLPNTQWRLKTRFEYWLDTGESTTKYKSLPSLDELVMRSDVADPHVNEDNRALLSLLKHMLKLDPGQRIKPNEALGHRFITMKHLQCDTVDCHYMEAANAIIERPSVEVTPFVTFSEKTSFKGDTDIAPPAETGSNDKTSGDAGNKDESSIYNSTSSISKDKTTDSGINKNPVMNERDSLDSPDGTPASNKEGNTGFAEVKARQMWIKNFDEFFFRTDTGCNDGSPEKAALDETTDPGIDKKPERNERDSSDSSDVIPIGNIEGNTGFVKVKTRKTFIERIRKFFSRSRAGRYDGPPQKASFDTIAGPRINKKPERNERDSFDSPDVIATGNIEGNTGFVKVKTRKTFIERIRKFFSRSRAGRYDEPPQKASFDTTAGPRINKKPERNERDSFDSPDVIATGNNEGNTGFVKVKTRKTFIERTRKFFSRSRAGRYDEPPQKASFDTTAGPRINKKPERNERDSFDSPDVIATGNNEGSTGFVKVKTRKTFIERTCKFFSRSRAGRYDEPPQKASFDKTAGPRINKEPDRNERFIRLSAWD